MTEDEAVEYISKATVFDLLGHAGYKACIPCRRYFHHPITFCPSCGSKITRNTEMPFVEFLKVRWMGAGPSNTLQAIAAKCIGFRGLEWMGSSEYFDSVMRVHKRIMNLCK